jgi:hypothetical protein
VCANYLEGAYKEWCPSIKFAKTVDTRYVFYADENEVRNALQRKDLTPFDKRVLNALLPEGPDDEVHGYENNPAYYIGRCGKGTEAPISREERAVLALHQPNPNIRYWDEAFYQEISKYQAGLKDPKASEFDKKVLRLALSDTPLMAQQLKMLESMKNVSVAVRYIEKKNAVTEFAQHVAKRAGPNTIHIFFGHGLTREGVVDERMVKVVEEALGKGTALTDRGKPPLFAFYSCFPGRYNSVIHKDNRLPFALMEKGASGNAEFAQHFTGNFKNLLNLLEGIRKGQADDKQVSVFLYFGWDGDYTKQERLDNQEKGRNNVFAKWKR